MFHVTCQLCFYLNLASFSSEDFKLSPWNRWTTLWTGWALILWPLLQMILYHPSPSFPFHFKCHQFECRFSLLRSNHISEGFSSTCMCAWVHKRDFLKFIKTKLPSSFSLQHPSLFFFSCLLILFSLDFPLDGF